MDYFSVTREALQKPAGFVSMDPKHGTGEAVQQLWHGSVHTVSGLHLKLTSNDADLLDVDLDPFSFFISKIRKLGFMDLDILGEGLLPGWGKVCVHCNQQDHSSNPNSAIH